MTAAFFIHSSEVVSNISITTGSIDINVKDSNDVKVESKNYTGVMSKSNLNIVQNNFTISNVGSLNSILSAAVVFDDLSSNKDDFKVYLTNTNNQLLELYNDGKYQPLSAFIESGDTFGVKIVYTGLFPQRNTTLGTKIVLRGIQPNDNLISPKMFRDTETINYTIQMNADDEKWLDIGKGFKVNYDQLDMYFGKNAEENTVNLNDGILKIQIPEGTKTNDYKFNFENSSSQAGVRYKSHTIVGNTIIVRYEINYALSGYSGTELSNNIIILIPITKNNDPSYYHQVNTSKDAFTRKLMLSTDSPIDWEMEPSYERHVYIKKGETKQISIKYIERSLNYTSTGGNLPDFILSHGEILGINAGNNHFTTSAIDNKIFIKANNNSNQPFDLRVTLKGNSGNTLIFKRQVFTDK